MKSVMSIVLAACFLVAAPGVASAAPECRSSFLPVDLQLPLPLPQLAWLVDPLQPRLLGERVFVRLCMPDGPTPETVLLLLHGITYTHRYWDIVDPTGGTDRYSFVASATGAGYATLAIDRIGIGQSSHPLSALIDMNQNAFVVHQVVKALRDGDISGPDGDLGFSKVVLVGHSYGSMVSWFEASRFQDVDGMVITGASHNVREVAVPLMLLPNVYPAMLDPRFALLGLDPGYLTTLPGKRYDLFYAPSTDMDPALIPPDEATKETTTATEFVTYPVLLRTLHDVRVPVFIINGELDTFFCSQAPLDLGADCSSPAGLIAGEEFWYGHDTPCIDAFITQDAGHNLNAFFSSQTSFNAILDWLDTRITPGAETPGC